MSEREIERGRAPAHLPIGNEKFGIKRDFFQTYI
jgi:hypothetical protein